MDSGTLSFSHELEDKVVGELFLEDINVFLWIRGEILLPSLLRRKSAVDDTELLDIDGVMEVEDCEDCEDGKDCEECSLEGLEFDTETLLLLFFGFNNFFLFFGFVETFDCDWCFGDLF